MRKHAGPIFLVAGLIVQLLAFPLGAWQDSQPDAIELARR